MEKSFKKYYVYIIYVVAILLFVIGFYLLKIKYTKKNDLNSSIVPVIKEEDELIEPVVSKIKNIIKPYNNDQVQISKNFYDKNQDIKLQEESLIYFESTYMPSIGVLYSSKDSFDILSIYDGEVISIEEDELLGKIIKVDYNNLIAVYEGVGDIKVEKGSKVKQGDILATSSTSKIFDNYNNILYFEIIKDGQNINPETVYNKIIDEI